MGFWLAGVLLAAVPIDVLVVEQEDMTGESLAVLTEAVAAAIERSGAKAHPIERELARCSGLEACWRVLSQRGAEQAVLVRAFGGPRHIRLIAELRKKDGRVEAKLDLPTDAARWPPLLDHLIRDLLPSVSRATPVPSIAPVSVQPVEGGGVETWFAAGGLALGVAGAVLAIARSPAGPSGAAILTPEKFREDSVRPSIVPSAVLLGASAACLTTALVLAALDG